MTDLTLRQLQTEQRTWVEHNFPNRTNYHPLLGAAEEIGELCHAHLKYEQGIRGYTVERYLDAACDAVGDVLIYLSDYCTANGINMQAALEQTWARVKLRDWQADPTHGGEGAA